MIQTKTLKEALKDPGVIEVVEELLPEVSSEDKGLFPSRYYHYACPLSVYDEEYRKIIVDFIGNNNYVFIRVETKKSAYFIEINLLNVYCYLLYGSIIPIYVNLELKEIYLGTTDYRKITIVQPFGGARLSFELFKDGKTKPTEEDGIKVL